MLDIAPAFLDYWVVPLGNQGAQINIPHSLDPSYLSIQPGLWFQFLLGHKSSVD